MAVIETPDDVTLIAPGPNSSKFATTQVVGILGGRTYYYWVIAKYPIGSTVSEPFLVRLAPDVLNVSNYVLISWAPVPKVLSYDLLRTDTPDFPQQSGNYAVVQGTTQTLWRDQGEMLQAYNLSGLQFGAPVKCRIFLNNRDYKQPTLEMPCQLGVTQLIFPDGSTQSTAGGGGGGQVQTPWLSDIDGAGHNLDNVTIIAANSIIANSITANSSLVANDTASGTSYLIMEHAGSVRWILIKNSTAEGTGNTGSDFQMARYDNTGNSTGVPLTILRSNGYIGLNNQTNPVYPLDVLGDVNCAGVFRVNGVPISQTPWLSDIAADGHNLFDVHTLALSGPDVTAPAAINFLTAGQLRWSELLLNPETGGNSGSDYSLTRYTDAQGFLGLPLQINRATGVVNFSATPTVNGTPLMAIVELPSVNPGVGLWYDPADGNRVKYAP